MDEGFAQLLESLGSGELHRSRLPELSDLDAEHLERLRQRWPDLGPEVRQSLLEELGLLADAQIELSFEAINRMALSDPDPIVRTQAIENLWECEDPSLASPLLSAVRRDPDPQVREAAAKALGAFVFLCETQNLPGDLQRAIEAGLLAATRTDSNLAVRERSLESLGFSSHAEVPGLIEAAYESEDDARLATALRAMARSANRQWIPNVLSKLHHPDPVVRAEAVRAAGELEARQAAPELIDLLDDASDGVRQAAIWSLGQLGGNAASEALGQLVDTTTDDAESALLHDALDNMVFVEGTRDMLRFRTDGPEDLHA